jgi:hypothetical protein
MDAVAAVTLTEVVGDHESKISKRSCECNITVFNINVSCFIQFVMYPAFAFRSIFIVFIIFRHGYIKMQRLWCIR